MPEIADRLTVEPREAVTKYLTETGLADAPDPVAETPPAPPAPPVVKADSIDQNKE